VVDVVAVAAVDGGLAFDTTVVVTVTLPADNLLLLDEVAAGTGAAAVGVTDAVAEDAAF